MIELKNINKTFKVAKRNAGFSEAVKALFKKEYTYINALRMYPSKLMMVKWLAILVPMAPGKVAP